MPDDTIVDAPISFPSVSGTWTPHNYDGKYEGTITLRHALAESRNIPAIKLAERVGIKTVIEYAHKFGITSEIEPYLPVALGSAEVTLLEHTAAYSTFPNDGVRLSPHSIRKVTDYDGHVMEQDFADVRDVISAHSARVMVELLQGVVQHGTGFAASKLNHPLAGKTGTTNDFTDAWFVGFSPSITCGVWVGYDEKKTLGNKETGAQAALPIWMDFMKVAIADKKDEQFPAAPPEARGRRQGDGWKGRHGGDRRRGSLIPLRLPSCAGGIFRGIFRCDGSAPAALDSAPSLYTGNCWKPDRMGDRFRPAMERVRLTIALLVLCLCSTTGCLFRSHRVEAKRSLAPLKTATQAELVAKINQLAASVQTMSATVDIDTTVGGEKKGKVIEYQQIRGYILAQKPKLLRMIGLLPIVRNRAFDMVSDGDHFELSIPPKNRFITGKDEVTKLSSNSLENLRPQVDLRCPADSGDRREE